MRRVATFLLNKKFGYTVVLSLFVVFALWWFLLNPFHPTTNNEYDRFVWGAFYQLISIFGGLYGLMVSWLWGGRKSLMGRSILVFSIGLLLQAFGQTVYSYYNLYLQVEAPYPSVGDIGFFGSVLFYIYGAMLFVRASGVRLSVKKVFSFIIAIVLPLIMLGFSYYEFLRDYDFSAAGWLQIFLDFGYPLGQAFYVSLAIVALILSYRILGGIMRLPIIILLLALLAQYIADFNFLFQFSRGTWSVAGYGDFLYMFSYLLMTLGLIQFGVTYKKIKEI